ncbi:MAG TPA: hypothetical protein VN971_02180 [Thermoanaerobaculia bacterium]|nr:hypothetical protein [Thermoanaerobaculia bacterium]
MKHRVGMLSCLFLLAALAPARGQELTPTPVPTPAPPAGPEAPAPVAAPSQTSNYFNPSISAIGNFLAVAGRNPVENLPNLNLRESEVGLQAIVDPYARADFFLSFGGEVWTSKRATSPSPLCRRSSSRRSDACAFPSERSTRCTCTFCPGRTSPSRS